MAKRYTVAVIFKQEYTVEVTAESEREAQYRAVSEGDLSYPTDTYLYETMVISESEIETDEETDEVQP